MHLSREVSLASAGRLALLLVSCREERRGGVLHRLEAPEHAAHAGGQVSAVQLAARAGLRHSSN